MSSLRARYPEELDRLIDRMLEPDPLQRISMEEAAESLRRFEPRSALRQRWKLAKFAVALSMALALIALLWVYRGTLADRVGAAHRIDLSRLTIRPLASQPGLEDYPSISPDGLWVSCLYRARMADTPQLQVHSINGGPPVVIQTGRIVVEEPAAWSPNSTDLVFSGVEGGSHEHWIYRVHQAGGTPVRIAKCRSRFFSGCEVDWSPDGRTLAVTDGMPADSALYLLDLSSGRRHDLISRDNLYVKTPRFSPDGRWIAYLKQPSLTSNDVYVMAATGGQPRLIARNSWPLKGFGWSTDGQSVLAFSSHSNIKPQLWQFPLNGSSPNTIGQLDGAGNGNISISRGKGSLAWVRDLSTNSLWRMPTVSSGEVPQQLINSAAVDVDAEWSRDGRMVFRSDRSGVNELWIANANGSGAWQATRFRGPFVGDPHWSPNGRSISFTSHVSGNPDVFVMQCEPGRSTCSEPRQLTRAPASDANPTWSADGRWIYFTSSRSGSYEVWRVPAEGSAEPVRVTWNGGYYARESADGSSLYFSKLAESTGIWRIALPARGPGQTETPVATDLPFKAAATWVLGTHELFYYPSTQDPAILFPSVRAVDVQTGRSRDLKLGDIRLGRGLSLSPDERWLLRSQTDHAQTLVMFAE